MYCHNYCHHCNLIDACKLTTILAYHFEEWRCLNRLLDSAFNFSLGLFLILPLCRSLLALLAVLLSAVCGRDASLVVSQSWWLEVREVKREEGREDDDVLDTDEEDEWPWAWSLANERALWILLDCRVSDMYCCSSVDKWYLEEWREH